MGSVSPLQAVKKASCKMVTPDQWRASSALKELPGELLALILAHIPQQQRLQSCALVCRSWHAAAVSLTNSIIVRPTTAAQHESLLTWLRKHGAGWVGTLQIHACAFPAGRQPLLPQRLPTWLPKLNSLELRNVTVHFTAAPALPSAATTASAQGDTICCQHRVLAAFTGLTCLQASDCTLSLKGLAACSNLQQLSLQQLQEPPCCKQTTCAPAAGGDDDYDDDYYYLFDDDGAAAPATATTPAATPTATATATAAAAAAAPADSSSILGQELRGLVCLTSLQLSGSCWAPAALAGLSACSKLQQLRLTNVADTLLSQPLDAPASMGALHIDLPPFSCISSPRTAGVLQGLHHLQELRIIGGPSTQISLEAVSTLVQLTALHMCYMPLLQAATAAGPELTCLTALTALQDLTCAGLVWPTEADDFSAADLAALTTSHFLTRLDLSEWEVPLAARSGLFLEGRVLAHLAHLALGPCWLHSRAAGQQLARACPRVCSLQVVAITPDSDGWDECFEKDTHRCVSLEGVTLLQHLTSLSFTGVGLSTSSTWQQLGRLTGLQRLSCRGAAFDMAALPDLLALTACVQLRAVNLKLSSGEGQAQHTIWINCHHRTTELLLSTGRVHHHHSPTIWWQLPAAAVQKAAWCCARLALAGAPYSAAEATAPAGGQSLAAVLPHAVKLAEQALEFYSKEVGEVLQQQVDQQAGQLAGLQAELQDLADSLARAQQQLHTGISEPSTPEQLPSVKRRLNLQAAVATEVTTAEHPAGALQQQQQRQEHVDLHLDAGGEAGGVSGVGAAQKVQESPLSALRACEVLLPELQVGAEQVQGELQVLQARLAAQQDLLLLLAQQRDVVAGKLRGLLQLQGSSVQPAAAVPDEGGE